MDSVAITVDHSDAADNAATQVSMTVIRDIVAPQVGLTTTDLNINKNIRESDLFALAGTCSTGDGNVRIELGTLPPLTTTCDPDGLWSLSSINTRDLGDGEGIRLVISQEDAAENVGMTESAVNKDIEAPTLALTSSLIINIANENSYQLMGTCSEMGESVSITLGTQDAQTTNCENDGTWTLPIENTLPENSYPLSITQRDVFDNEGALAPGSVLLKDTTAPVFAINSDQNINAANQGAYYVSGTCQEDGVLSVTVGGLNPVTGVNCSSGTWSIGPIVVGEQELGADGTYTISATMVDGAGNSGVAEMTATITKNTSSRAVAIDLPLTPINAGQ